MAEGLIQSPGSAQHGGSFHHRVRHIGEGVGLPAFKGPLGHGHGIEEECIVSHPCAGSGATGGLFGQRHHLPHLLPLHVLSGALAVHQGLGMGKHPVECWGDPRPDRWQDSLLERFFPVAQQTVNVLWIGLP